MRVPDRVTIKTILADGQSRTCKDAILEMFLIQLFSSLERASERASEREREREREREKQREKQMRVIRFTNKIIFFPFHSLGNLAFSQESSTTHKKVSLVFTKK